ncbi:MAG: glycosyltransferase [Syntrophobacteraceae bacterium]
MFINPQPYIQPHNQDDPFLIEYRADSDWAKCHKRNAVSYLDRLMEYSANGIERLLLVADNGTYIMDEARQRGLNVDQMTFGDFSQSLPHSDSRHRYDACILVSVLEKCAEPEIALNKIKALLTADGSLMVIYPSIDSWSARLFRSKWWEFRKENLFYFDITTMQNLLLKVGYEDPLIFPDYRNVSLNYAKAKLGSMRKGLWRTSLAALLYLAPTIIWDFPFRFWDSRKIVISRPKMNQGNARLTVIVPVFNEKQTFSQLIETLLAKEIPDIEIEVIIVESNSTDGSREDVVKYQTHPRVKVLLEDTPRGKGHAVRTGLNHATGDIILIQDADLEYDINDYDALVEPLLRHQQCFVIGSRHVREKQAWKVREFNQAPVVSWIFNFGHLLFLSMFNCLYRQSLRDPFSMFKVFRRECLYGLSFECNRFDFDFEIVIKLLRKGYRPVELPVNYRARSLGEGKKVSITRDPFTWLRALVRFRFSRLYKKRDCA